MARLISCARSSARFLEQRRHNYSLSMGFSESPRAGFASDNPNSSGAIPKGNPCFLHGSMFCLVSLVAGGSFGRREHAQEEQYFRRKEAEELREYLKKLQDKSSKVKRASENEDKH
jgi:hypothetical protein